MIATLLFAGAPTLAATADDNPAPMDLVWDATDVNGVALNPKWGLQVTDPGALPDVPQLCFVQPDGPFDSSLCSTQALGIDRPAGLRRLICSIGSPTSLPGHVNWYPGTFAGPIYWDSLSFVDRDDNVRLIPPEQNALTANNPDNIKGEFDSRETTSHFATPWWSTFRRARNPKKKRLIDGKPAIISGYTSVDCEHHCVSELHPTWVLAIHVQDDPDDDVWAVFMRNWGNEGFPGARAPPRWSSTTPPGSWPTRRASPAGGGTRRARRSPSRSRCRPRRPARASTESCTCAGAARRSDPPSPAAGNDHRRHRPGGKSREAKPRPS
ncbi:MAG: hypothetical protein DMF82_07970 [Acidobacteria bacterium]|nr:MAG: hypothetical protein DMF82_07970 [Acidobacteriota bacterium]